MWQKSQWCVSRSETPRFENGRNLAPLLLTGPGVEVARRGRIHTRLNRSLPERILASASNDNKISWLADVAGEKIKKGKLSN